jgi:hypothetical protein
MEIAMTPGLSDAQIKAADAALVHNEALKEQKKHLDGLVYGMGKYAKELEDLVDRLARPAGTPNLGDPLNQGPLPPILRGATPQEHDSGLMRGHAGDPTFGYTQQDIALIGDANAGLSALSGTMQTVQDLLPTIADGFAMVFEQLGSGGFDAAAKSFGKFIGQLAAMEGKLLILEGLGKIAKGLFPPIPALLTSGIKMVAAGAALEVFAGSLGGGAGGTSGGTGAGGGTTAPNQSSQPLPSKGTLTISVPRHAYSGWSDPGFQEFIVQTIAGASGRGVRMVTR